jgi:hydroxyacylglutathione hydrolase
MIKVHHFCFNPFQENTYILSDETRECLIIDPGCYDSGEQQMLVNYITAQGLVPVRLLNTHCHVDHVFGNRFIADKYGLKLEIHPLEKPVLKTFLQVAHLYNLQAEASPEPGSFLKEGEFIHFGKSELEIRFTPGHSPGSICFVSKDQQFVIGGDVLFQGSIGRTDLPGGDHATLLDSIRTQLFVLADAYTVYPGHGDPTTIGFEKQYNPFLS